MRTEPRGRLANRLPEDGERRRALVVDVRRHQVGESAEALGRLADLMATDVDDQRTTPLTIFREAIREPTAWLRSHDVRSPGASADGGAPDDVYRLGPATWSDIDPALHEPGLRWGAWKAMTVLARRRDEGLR